MEGPHQLAGPGVPGARIARGSGSGRGAARAFAGARAGDDQILVDTRRRQQRVGQVRPGLHDFWRLEGDDAILAEPLVERAARRRERVELACRRSEDDRRRERERASDSAAGPVRHAALRRQLIVGKLKLPFLRPGRGVQGDDRAIGRGEIHRVANHNGNGLVFPHRAGKARRLEMNAPGPLERADVRFGDLGERAVAVGGLIVVGARPVGCAGRPVRAAHCRGGCCQGSTGHADGESRGQSGHCSAPRHGSWYAALTAPAMRPGWAMPVNLACSSV